MSVERFPIGQEMDVTYPNFKVSLALLSATQLRFEINEGPFARSETVDIQVVDLGSSIFAVSWKEMDGATVTNVQDHDRGLIHSFATLPGGEFIRMTGRFAITRHSDRVSDHRPERNKALVIEAMTSLFQRRDASTVEKALRARLCPTQSQHSPRSGGIADARRRPVPGRSL